MILAASVRDSSKTVSESGTDLDGGGRVGLFAVDGDDRERVRQTEHISLGQRVSSDDCKGGGSCLVNIYFSQQPMSCRSP